MIDYTEQGKLFQAIGDVLKEQHTVYVIGGSAMLYYKAKNVTKDIDLVATSKESFSALVIAIKELGFSEKSPFIHSKYNSIPFDKPIFLILSDKRIDLFLKRVICFDLSIGMQERAVQAHLYGNLIVRLVSPEDIFLMKCATEREGDRIDANELLRIFNINWDTIINEAELQSKQDLFIVYLYDFLLELKGVPNEIIKRVTALAMKKLKKAKSTATVKK